MWKQGMSSFLGTLLALATAAKVTEADVRIWTDIGNDGSQAKMCCLDVK